MMPNRRLGMKRVAELALIVAVAGFATAVLISCEYFDPLDPLSRGPRDSESTNMWTKFIISSIEGTGNGDDAATCIQQTKDQGFIITGYMQSKVGTDYNVWLVKTDSHGNEEWDMTYGGGGNDRAFYVEQTSDEGYIVVGYKEFDRGGGAWDADLWLFKVKPDAQGPGVMDWERLYGESGIDEEGYCVRCTDDGGYIITGSKVDSGAGFDCLWLIKTDAAGNLDPAWNSNPNTFWGTATTYGACVSQTEPDNGYIAAGASYLDTSHDAYLIKTDGAGSLSPMWATNPLAFGAADEPDYAYYVQQTFDGGYILAGETRSFGAAGMDALVIKLDAYGNLDSQWETNPKTFHSPNDSGGHDRANCIQQASDGGYVLAGMTHGNDQDAWLVKMDASGNMLWEKYFGGDGHDEASSVRETVDGGYILAGMTNSYPGGFNMYLAYYKP